MAPPTTVIQVWRAVTLVREYDGDIAKTAQHLSWPDSKVKAALNYAEAFPQEIEDAIAVDQTYDFDTLKRLIPSLERFEVPSLTEDSSIVDGKTISQRDIGGLVKAICWLWDKESQTGRRNRTVYLRPDK